MADDSRVEQLLDKLLDSDATPEDDCASRPELLPAVRDSWRQLRQVEADLDSLFPPRASDPAATTDEPLAAADRAGGIGIPAGVSNTAARYRLGEEIARGGMGAVYRTTDTVLGREVAVKVLQEKYAPDSGTARRFADEARI